MNDEEFAYQLRAKVARVNPNIAVDPEMVVRAGHRRQAVRTSLAGIAAVGVVGLAAAAALTVSPRSSVHPASTSQPVSVASLTGDEASPTGRAVLAAEAPNVAAALDESTWQTAKFWYVKTVNTEGTTYESWHGSTELGLSVWEGDFAGATVTEPGGAWTLDGYDPATGSMAAWNTVFELPTDPAELDARLRAAANDDQRNGSVDDKVWGQIVDMWPGGPAPRAVRLAFFQVAQSLPGAQVTEGVTDSLNRPGTAISRPEVMGGNFGTATLIVDPVDGTVLERRVESPDESGWETYLASGPADELPIPIPCEEAEAIGRTAPGC